VTVLTFKRCAKHFWKCFRNFESLKRSKGQGSAGRGLSVHHIFVTFCNRMQAGALLLLAYPYILRFATSIKEAERYAITRHQGYTLQAHIGITCTYSPHTPVDTPGPTYVLLSCSSNARRPEDYDRSTVRHSTEFFKLLKPFKLAPFRYHDLHAVLTR
jgi:hypothetical protein